MKKKLEIKLNVLKQELERVRGRIQAGQNEIQQINQSIANDVALFNSTNGKIEQLEELLKELEAEEITAK